MAKRKLHFKHPAHYIKKALKEQAAKVELPKPGPWLPVDKTYDQGYRDGIAAARELLEAQYERR